MNFENNNEVKEKIITEPQTVQEKSIDESSLEKFYEERQIFWENSFLSKNNNYTTPQNKNTNNISENSFNNQNFCNIKHNSDKNLCKTSTSKIADSNNIIPYSQYKSSINNNKLNKLMNKDIEMLNSQTSKNKIVPKTPSSHKEKKQKIVFNTDINKSPKGNNKININKSLNKKINSFNQSKEKSYISKINNISTKLNSFRQNNNVVHSNNKNNSNQDIRLNGKIKHSNTSINNKNISASNLKSKKCLQINTNITNSNSSNENIMNLIPRKSDNFTTYFPKKLTNVFKPLALINNTTIPNSSNIITNSSNINYNNTRKQYKYNETELQLLYNKRRQYLQNNTFTNTNTNINTNINTNKTFTNSYMSLDKTNTQINENESLNYINNICNTFNNVTNNKKLDFFTRNLNYQKTKNEKIKKLKDELAKKELKECIFTPKIDRNCKSSKKISITKSMNNTNITNNTNNTNNSKAKTSSSFSEFYTKNLNWKNERDNSIKEQVRFYEMKKYEECSFQPNYNDHIKQKEVINDLKGKEKDFMYKKNIQWLDQVNQNKKQSQLEQVQYWNEEFNKAQEQNKKLSKVNCKTYSQLGYKYSKKINDDRNVGKYDKSQNSFNKNNMLVKKNKTGCESGYNFIDNYYQCQYTESCNNIKNNNNMNNKEFDEIKKMLSSLKKTLTNNKKLNEKIDNDSD